MIEGRDAYDRIDEGMGAESTGGFAEGVDQEAMAGTDPSLDSLQQNGGEFVRWRRFRRIGSRSII